jgi:2-desacetyl-2-hydroxyethyl bacteriochlorophyllide A dehydrogenase
MTKTVSTASNVVFTGPLKVELLQRRLRGVRAHEVLVKTRQTLISTGTELTVLRGAHQPGSTWARLFEYPWDAGYCNVGVVLETGKAVTRLKPGDRVASAGPHASMFVALEEDCSVIPPGVSDDEAVFSSIFQIVMQGVRLARPLLGENAVVCGLGLLGQVTTALARFVGCWPVIGVDLERSRQEMALQMGATAVTGPDLAKDFIRQHSDERLADIVFEVTGNPKAIPVALEWVRGMGRFVLVSSPSGPTTVDFHDLVNARGTVIIGAHNFTHPTVPTESNRWTRIADTRHYLRLTEAGLFKASKVITHRFPARRAPEAYEQLLNGGASSLAVVLQWDED